MYAELEIALQPSEKIYFASDIHLGEPDYATTRKRESRLIEWLHAASKDAAAIFLVGDIFDFWFEYQHVVPKGYVRFMATVAALTDQGMPVYVFPGNHDMWMNDYLEKELGVKIFREQVVITSNGKKIFVAHGDGLGPGDFKYKLIKKVFTNPFCRWLFRWLHPDIGIKIANLWSRNSRQGHNMKKKRPIESEWLVAYARRKLEAAHYDYFIFGHRHIPSTYDLNDKSQYINLGDWIENETFGVFDGEELRLTRFS